MEAWNAADVLGALFLGFGMVDGYRKGLVKKGSSMLISLLTLSAVYLVSPYVAQFFTGIMPKALSLENLAGADSEIYRILVLSGFEEEAEAYVQAFAARILSVVVTYGIVKIFLRTVMFSLEILVKVPGLSLTNRLLGALLGLLLQLMALWMIFLVVLIFSGAGWGGYIQDLVRNSFWIRYLYENNLLLLIGILLILGI